jgi:short-subunit dehydrogenase
MGAEYCRQLAAQGLNIVLVSRTLLKLKNVEKELNTKWPNVKTMVI